MVLPSSLAHISLMDEADFAQRVDLTVPVECLVGWLGKTPNAEQFIAGCNETVSPTFSALFIKLLRNKGLAFRALMEDWTVDDLAAADV